MPSLDIGTLAFSVGINTYEIIKGFASHFSELKHHNYTSEQLIRPTMPRALVEHLVFHGDDPKKFKYEQPLETLPPKKKIKGIKNNPDTIMLNNYYVIKPFQPVE
jgi:hypothetical protein